MAVYHLWITLMSEQHADPIISVLVKNKFEVKAIKDDFLCFGEKDYASTVLGLKIVNEESSCQKIVTKIIELLEETNIKYYSIVVCGDCGGSSWYCGNISLEHIQKLQSIV